MYNSLYRQMTILVTKAREYLYQNVQTGEKLALGSKTSTL